MLILTLVNNEKITINPKEIVSFEENKPLKNTLITLSTGVERNVKEKYEDLNKMFHALTLEETNKAIEQMMSPIMQMSQRPPKNMII